MEVIFRKWFILHVVKERKLFSDKNILLKIDDNNINKLESVLMKIDNINDEVLPFTAMIWRVKDTGEGK